MNDYINKLHELVALNRIEQLIKILLETVNDFSAKKPEKAHEIVELRSQIILLSARFNETTEKINNGVIDANHAQTAKNQVLSAFINLINNLYTYGGLAEYIKDFEEQKAWEITSSTNTIAAYKAFFEKYPNGKYKEETAQIIGKLEDINRKNENEIKQKAQEEKEWREREEQKKYKPINKNIIYGLPETSSNLLKEEESSTGISIIGRRFLAFFIDLVLSIVFPLFALTVVSIIDDLISGNSLSNVEEIIVLFPSTIILTIILKYKFNIRIMSKDYLYLYIPLCYFLIRDSYSSGQSFGKKIMNLIVIYLPNNKPCTSDISFYRNVILLPLIVISAILPPISILLVIPLIYTIVKHKGLRRGDIVAKTVVTDVLEYERGIFEKSKIAQQVHERQAG